MDRLYTRKSSPTHLGAPPLALQGLEVLHRLRAPPHHLEQPLSHNHGRHRCVQSESQRSRKPHVPVLAHLARC
jgi:hypothetical protein